MQFALSVEQFCNCVTNQFEVRVEQAVDSALRHHQISSLYADAPAGAQPEEDRVLRPRVVHQLDHLMQQDSY